MSDGTGRDGKLSRRKVLALTLSGTAAGLAGCGGGGGGTTTTTTTDGTGGDTTTQSTTTQGTDGTTTDETTTTQDQLSPGEMADSVADVPVAYPPQDANWNIFSNGPNEAQFTWDHTAYTFWNNETVYWLLKDDGYSYDPKTRTATYEFKENYSYWWNGEPVTAEDFWMEQEIMRLQDPENSDIESWSLDGNTVSYTRKNKINPILLGKGEDTVHTYREKYRSWLQKLQDATTQSERTAITKQLTEMKISSEEFASEGLGNTTYKLTDTSTTEYLWEKFGEHPLADQITVPQIRFRVGSGSAVNQMISNDRVDFNSGKFPANLRSVSPEYLETLFERKTIQCRNLLFNYKNKHIGRRNVRRALMTILDFTHLKNYWQGKGGFTKEVQTGLPRALESQWLGDELMSQMYRYPVKSDPDLADQFMRDAGYSKQGGTWIGPDGDPLKFTFMVGSFLTSETLAKAMDQTWKQWGAKSELLIQENSQWIQDTADAKGWDITMFLHGFNALNPLNYFNYNSHWFMRLGPQTKVKQWLEEGKTHSQINGRPITPTIPSQPGALTVEGDGKKINIFDLVNELKVTPNRDRTREITRQLARYWNYDLPEFDMFPQTSAMWGDTKNFKWPEEDPNAWYTTSFNAKYLTFRKGHVDPVPKDQA